MSLRDLSDKQIERLEYRILCRVHSRHSGDPYGVDARTLAIIDPSLYRAYRDVRAEVIRRRTSA